MPRSKKRSKPRTSRKARTSRKRKASKKVQIYRSSFFPKEGMEVEQYDDYYPIIEEIRREYYVGNKAFGNFQEALEFLKELTSPTHATIEHRDGIYMVKGLKFDTMSNVVEFLISENISRLPFADSVVAGPPRAPPPRAPPQAQVGPLPPIPPPNLDLSSVEYSEHNAEAAPGFEGLEPPHYGQPPPG